MVAVCEFQNWDYKKNFKMTTYNKIKLCFYVSKLNNIPGILEPTAR